MGVSPEILGSYKYTAHSVTLEPLVGWATSSPMFDVKSFVIDAQR